MAVDLNRHLLDEAERVCEMLGAAEAAIEQLADELTVYGARIQPGVPDATRSALRHRLRELAAAADHCHTFATQALQALETELPPTTSHQDD